MRTTPSESFCGVGLLVDSQATCPEINILVELLSCVLLGVEMVQGYVLSSHLSYTHCGHSHCHSCTERKRLHTCT